MYSSITANALWKSLSNCAMWFVIRCMCLLVFASTDDARPVSFLFSILVKLMFALVLMDGGVSVFCVLDLVLCSGAVLLIAAFFAI